jgi:hypothetical protein
LAKIKTTISFLSIKKLPDEQKLNKFVNLEVWYKEIKFFHRKKIA